MFATLKAASIFGTRLCNSQAMLLSVKDRVSPLVQECDSFYLDSFPKIPIYANKSLQPSMTVGQVRSARTFMSEVTQMEPGQC